MVCCVSLITDIQATKQQNVTLLIVTPVGPSPVSACMFIWQMSMETLDIVEALKGWDVLQFAQAQTRSTTEQLILGTPFVGLSITLALRMDNASSNHLIWLITGYFCKFSDREDQLNIQVHRADSLNIEAIEIQPFIR